MFYEIDFAYKISEFGTVSLEADDPEQAEQFAREYVRDTFNDVTDVIIDYIKEVK